MLRRIPSFLVVFFLSSFLVFSQESPSEPILDNETLSEEALVPATEEDKADELSSENLADAVKDEPSLDIRALDFSEAHISLAGPASLYLRGVKGGEERYSLLFKRNTESSWELSEIFPDSSNVFPSNMIFEFASLQELGDGVLSLQGILLDGQTYTATINLQGEKEFSMDAEFQAGELVGTSLERLRSAARPAYEPELSELDKTKRMNQDLLLRIGDLQTADASSDQNELLELKGQVSALSERNASLNTELEGLKAELVNAQNEKTLLEQDLAALKAAESSESPAAEEPVVSEPVKELAKETKAADSEELLKLQEEIRALSDKVSKLTEAIETTKSQVNTPELLVSEDYDALKAEVLRLGKENERLMVERNNLEQKIREGFVRDGYIATFKPSLKNKVLEGFDSAKARLGTWDIKKKTAVQKDKTQYFAQLDLPLVQDGKTLLYHFKAKSLGKDWVGLGLHIFASNSSLKGYGHGESLLVWLTRDPEFYQNKNTYLQLYRSDSDISMGRVLDSAVQENIADELTIDVLYQPKEEYVTVAINGVEKIRYKTWFGIDQGVEVSLRSLDTAQFSDLEVWSE